MPILNALRELVSRPEQGWSDDVYFQVEEAARNMNEMAFHFAALADEDVSAREASLLRRWARHLAAESEALAAGEDHVP